MSKMASISTFEMIADDDELLSQTAKFVPTDDGDVIVLPIQRMGQFGIWCLTIALAAISTPLCYFVGSSLTSSGFHAPVPVLMKYVPFVAWILAVFGPVAVYYTLPCGWWNPDHWLKYDRRTQQFSVRGCFYQWHRDQIISIVAVAGARKPRGRTSTELQICVNEQDQVNKYLLMHTVQTDPETAFGKIVREFAFAMKVPAYFAKLTDSGKVDVQQISDEQSIR